MKKVQKRFELDLSAYKESLATKKVSKNKFSIIPQEHYRVFDENQMNEDTLVVKRFWLQASQHLRTS